MGATIQIQMVLQYLVSDRGDIFWISSHDPQTTGNFITYRSFRCALVLRGPHLESTTNSTISVDLFNLMLTVEKAIAKI